MPNLILNRFENYINNPAEIPTTPIDIQYLYSCLMFFDKLAYLNPSSSPSMVSFGGQRHSFLDTQRGHLRELSELGLLKAHHYGPHLSTGQAIDQYIEFLQEWSKDDWLIHPSLIYQGSSRTVQYAALRFEVVGGFYFPSAAVHMEDVLRFKENRSSELSAFWHEILAATQNVDFDDRSGRLHIERANLEASLRAFNAVSGEMWRDRVLRTAQFRIQPGSDTIATIAAALALRTGTWIDLLHVVSINATIFKVDVTLSPSAAPTEGARGVAYLSEAMKAFHI